MLEHRATPVYNAAVSPHRLIDNELQWQFEREGGAVVVYLRGVLDERAQLSALVRLLHEPVVFDLEGIVRVTSYGGQQWLRLMDQIAALGEHQLRRCSPVFVAQLNMVPNFRQGVRILSVMGPFICPETDEEFIFEIPIAGEEALLPTPQHPQTGTPLQFDDLVPRYFSFLRVGSAGR